MSEKSAKVLRRYIRLNKLNRQDVSDIRYILSHGTSTQKSFILKKMRNAMPELYFKKRVREIAQYINSNNGLPDGYYNGWRKDFNPQ